MPSWGKSCAYAKTGLTSLHHTAQWVESVLATEVIMWWLQYKPRSKNSENQRSRNRNDLKTEKMWEVTTCPCWSKASVRPLSRYHRYSPRAQRSWHEHISSTFWCERRRRMPTALACTSWHTVNDLLGSPLDKVHLQKSHREASLSSPLLSLVKPRSLCWSKQSRLCSCKFSWPLISLFIHYEGGGFCC